MSRTAWLLGQVVGPIYVHATRGQRWLEKKVRAMPGSSVKGAG